MLSPFSIVVFWVLVMLSANVECHGRRLFGRYHFVGWLVLTRTRQVVNALITLYVFSYWC